MRRVIDFDNFATGQVIDDEFAFEGITVTTDGGSDQAMIFDTANPTGGDTDLATNDLGNVLIISEDGDSNDPDDNAGGGKITFDFDFPVTDASVTLLDIEEGAFVKYFAPDGSLIDTDFAQTLDGGRETEPVSNPHALIGRIEIHFCGSGALAELSYIRNPMAPCFTPGTLIATARGIIPVELLKEGDRVITRDNGFQPIRWIGSRSFAKKDLAFLPELNPIKIAAGSLGDGLPERDMIVSPQHRLLVHRPECQVYLEEAEAFVVARHLVGQKGITQMSGAPVTYTHFICDNHEVVLSNGSWTESFQPGAYALARLDREVRNEIFQIFPEFETESGIAAYASARKSANAKEAALLFEG
ncbi:MAG: Hint domain-containing protein [Pseudomonadota bacterium]